MYSDYFFICFFSIFSLRVHTNPLNRTPRHMGQLSCLLIWTTIQVLWNWCPQRETNKSVFFKSSIQIAQSVATHGSSTQSMRVAIFCLTGSTAIGSKSGKESWSLSSPNIEPKSIFSKSGNGMGGMVIEDDGEIVMDSTGVRLRVDGV